MKTPTTPRRARGKPAARAPGYYAVIPASVLFDLELLPWAKLIYGAVAAMAAKTGEAWPTNKHLAEIFGLSADAVSRLVTSLIERGHLVVRFEKSEGNTRYLSLIKQEPAAVKKAVTISAQEPRGGIGRRAEMGIGRRAERGIGCKAATLSAQEPFPYKAEKSEKLHPPYPPVGGEERTKRARAADAASSPPPGWLVNEVGRMQTALRGFLEKHPEAKATPAARKKHPKLMPLQMAADAALDLLADHASEKTRPTKAIIREELQLLAATLRDAAKAAGWRPPLPDLALRAPEGARA